VKFTPTIYIFCSIRIKFDTRIDKRTSSVCFVKILKAKGILYLRAQMNFSQCSPIWVKVSYRKYVRNAFGKTCNFRENRCSEGRNFVTGVTEIMCTRDRETLWYI
jgi:hypothetical protein